MKKHTGFTIIELLVVIFIISILTGIGLVSFSGAQKQARDTTRRSDLQQYRNAIENYAANNSGLYPLKNTSPVNTSFLCNVGETYNIANYIASCPVDPKFASDATWFYKYASSADRTAYMLTCRFETGKYMYLCSNGTAGTLDSWPVASACGF